MKKQQFSTSSVQAKTSTSSKMFASPDTSPEVDDLSDELKELLEAGQDRFQKSMAAWSKQRKSALDDLHFYRGDQWNQDLQRTGSIRKEPTLTVNRLPQFCKQVENELRKQQVAINVYPTDEIGSEDTAQIFAGLIRDIERKSYAPSAYIHAAGEAGAMVPGFGFLKITTCYAGSKGFNQEIRIESPHDPFKIVPDGDSVEMDSSDAQCWFEFEDYSEDAYRAVFPDSTLASADLTVIGAKLSGWVGANGVRVVKYWYKEEQELIEYLMSDGTTRTNEGWFDPNEETTERENARSANPDDIENEDEQASNLGIEAPGTRQFGKVDDKVAVLRTRHVTDTKIKWVTFNGAEVLDQGEWADSEFPFVSIYGPTLIVDGERDIRGIVRFAKDSQKMLNYMASSTVRRLGSANKSPWIVDAKSIKGYENQWKTANTENWSMLPYNSIDPDNPSRPLNPPQRADQTGQIGDLLQAAVKFENDLKATIGIYDAGLGATANDQSGIAIKTLAEQGNNSNFHFSDALARAIQRLGYLLIRLIPKIYDTPRAVRIIGDDSQERMVRINQIFTENGEQKLYSMTEGDYGVAVSAGPSYASRKSQSLDQLIRLANADPTLMPFIQDLIVGEMDFDSAPVIQKRLQKLLAMKAPGLVEQEGQVDVPPQVQAAMAQQSQMIQQLSQELQKVHDELQKAQFDIATKNIDHQNQMELVRMKTEAELLLERARMERDKASQETKVGAELVKTHLDHSHKMANVVLDAHKSGVQYANPNSGSPNLPVRK